MTPSSSTWASRVLPAAITSSSAKPVGAHRQHLLEPDAQAHHLESAAVGERRAGPVHERAEPAGRLDDVRTGLQIEVVGVGQHGLRTECGHALRQHGLDRGLGAHRDEGRRVDHAVRGGDRPGTPEPAGQPGADGEAESGHRARSIPTATTPAVEVRRTPSLIRTGRAPALTKASQLVGSDAALRSDDDHDLPGVGQVDLAQPAVGVLVEHQRRGPHAPRVRRDPGWSAARRRREPAVGGTAWPPRARSPATSRPPASPARPTSGRSTGPPATARSRRHRSR